MPRCPLLLAVLAAAAASVAVGAAAAVRVAVGGVDGGDFCFGVCVVVLRVVLCWQMELGDGGVGRVRGGGNRWREEEHTPAGRRRRREKHQESDGGVWPRYGRGSCGVGLFSRAKTVW